MDWSAELAEIWRYVGWLCYVVPGGPLFSNLFIGPFLDGWINAISWFAFLVSLMLAVDGTGNYRRHKKAG